MAEITLNASTVGTSLMGLLAAPEIEPGSQVGYQTAKTILLYHPMGMKIAEFPVKIAQSQPRKITVQDSPEEMVVKKFNDQWKADRANTVICNTMTQVRAYGAAVLGVGVPDQASDQPISPVDYLRDDLFFSTFDPLNTAGSLVTSQDPNSPLFQKIGDITVNGVVWHRSRTCTVFNGSPIYLSYSPSAFGYVGRSVYQSALFPLKSFIASMIADDMVATKLGLLIVKAKSPGSIVDKVMQGVAALKRGFLKGAATNNVLTIDVVEAVETLNMMNVDGAGKYSRDNIVTNIALATPMPARWLKEESLAEGFGEGSEDAKAEARYADDLRDEMQPFYDFMDPIIQTRAWTREFYATVQAKFPREYGGISFEAAFKQWQNSFEATWPKLDKPSDDEASKMEKVKFDAAIQTVTLLLPSADPANQALIVDWLSAVMNENKLLFGTPLVLDSEAWSTKAEEDDEFSKEQETLANTPDEPANDKAKKKAA